MPPTRRQAFAVTRPVWRKRLRASDRADLREVLRQSETLDRLAGDCFEQGPDCHLEPGQFLALALSDAEGGPRAEA